VLLIEVGDRAGVPLFGVGLPGHFLVRHARHAELVLDPFDRGRILTRTECAEILKKVFGGETELEPRMLQPVDSRQILARMHHNLRAIYLERGDLKKSTRVIDRLVRLEPAEPRHRRDRGVLRLHASDPRGLEDLEHYLAEAGDASDREETEALLAKARRKLAQVH
jgi:regulator of sirC expression with transglutaminase-like and TPR domain